jgi:hypothetical protein
VSPDTDGARSRDASSQVVQEKKESRPFGCSSPSSSLEKHITRPPHSPSTQPRLAEARREVPI